MAGTSLPLEIAELLKILQLEKFYPEKLTRDDLYQISKQSILPKAQRHCSLSWQFIYELTRYNYQARNVQSEETNTVKLSRMGLRERFNKEMEHKQSDVHPLDIIVSVFLCCEPTARQDLVMHLWGCKLAIPLVIQTFQTGILTAFIWPLRCLTGPENGVEMPLTDMSVNTISFIRVGENENISKSFLLNCFIHGPEKAHPMFFHRDSQGSKKDRSCISNGLVELGWFFPKNSPTDTFSSPRLFLNLRGDAKDLPRQVQLLGEMSTVSVVICTVNSLRDSDAVIRSLLSRKSSIVILVTDKQPNLDRVKKNMEPFPESIYPTDLLDIILVEDLRLGEILSSLQHNVERMEQVNKKTKALEGIPLSEGIYVDERDKQYQIALHYAGKVISSLETEKAECRKKVFFPLQETFWKDWSKLDRDFHRFEQLEGNERSKYGSRSKVESKLRDTRSSQFKFLLENQITNPMHYFLYALSYFDEKSKRIFLRYLKLKLNHLSQKHMAPFYLKYHKLILQQEQANEKDRSVITEKLSELDIQKTNISLGLEHFLREMGQIFEACQSCSGKDVILADTKLYKIHHNQLPKAACISLLEGYPLEILDGEACSVPMSWVNSILEVFPSLLAKKSMRVHIISVLGIQSSGKSTFLNTMFGLQFAVSAGRCTRGAFMQLVKVSDDLRNELNTDYVLAIDTEGLKSAELTSNEFVKHDNELSTFVIGLADTTVINLMGENTSYLQDNLPIVVHAFLRMNLVGLHPRCIIVHHNVDKRNKEKLLQQGHFLETVLNKYTQKACVIEKTPDKLFKEIIEFNISEHTDYVPALLEGEQPMAPVSTGYSCEANMVRTKLINFVEKSSDLSNLHQFRRHLENLWTAIKRDRFVYEFKTTLETEARINLDNGYFKIINKYLRKLDSLNTDLKQSISKKRSLQNSKDKYLSLSQPLEKKYRKKLQQFFDEPKKVRSDRIESWEKEYTNNFKDIVIRNTKSDLQNIENNYAQVGGLHISCHQYEYFSVLFSKNKDLNVGDEELAFEKTWNEWTDSINVEKNDVLSDTTAALHSVCSSHKYLLEESNLRQTSLHSFTPSVSRHINHPLKGSSEEYLLLKLDDIRQTVIREYDAELNDIKQNQLTYSSRYPLMILLKIENHLKCRLQNEDHHTEIKNNFIIDILLCTAGNCVNDLEKRNEEFPQFLTVKFELKKVAKGDGIINDVTSALKLVLQKVVYRSFSLRSMEILNCSLENSVWRYDVRTKESLLGNCLKYIVTSEDNKLLLCYVNTPLTAVEQYLCSILHTVLHDQSFRAQCELLVTSEVNKLLELIRKFLTSRNERLVTPKELIQDIISQTNLSKIDISLIAYHMEKNSKLNEHYLLSGVDFDRELRLYSQEQNYFEYFKMCSISNGTVKLLAHNLGKQRIGCQDQCPFCKELCRYSAQHPGEHECYIHRPVGCAGYHWSETTKLSYETCPQHVLVNNRFQHANSWVDFKDYRDVYPNWKLYSVPSSEPASIWKFIFVQKHSFLKAKFELPENLPDTWKRIKEHEALREINKQFCMQETTV